MDDRNDRRRRWARGAFYCYDFVIGVTKYGLLLFQNRSDPVSTNSELERKDKSVLIDPEALHEEEISNQIDYLLDIATYMENLALLDGANVVSY